MNQSSVLWFLLLVCLSWTVNVKAQDTATLDFIYVNANTGEAAGGHTAIRLGSTVFHYQFFPQGQFLLVRDSWSHFRYVYNELRNRSIFVARTPLTPPVYVKLRNHFTRLLMEQQQDLNQLQAVETQLSLLMQLAAGSNQLEMNFVGLFDHNKVGDLNMHRLHQVIQHKLGDNYLVARQEQMETKLESLIADLGVQDSTLSWAEKLQGLLLEREFFQLLEAGVSLAEDSVFGSSMNAFKLTTEQRLSLEKYREKLVASVVGLLQSRRPDRSTSLMLQTARYLVVSHSLETGVLLTLDPFSSRANPLVVKQKNELSGLQAQLQQDARQAQRNFFNETTHFDIAYAILESSMGRWHEIARAWHQGGEVRVEPGILLPVRKGHVSASELPFLGLKLPELIEAIEVKQSQLRQHVETQYTYDLIAQNCVTELLRALNTAFPNKAVGQKALGGWLAPDEALVFIPSQFYAQSDQRFPIQEKAVYPSRRLRQLDEFYARRSVLQVWLRESNTLSSTLYTSRTEDTPFLFFTDDTLLLRPILGITNLVWGAANSIGGVFALPIDGGERLYQGLRGMFYSLPELVFGNIRKGTYGYTETATVGP